MIRLTTLINPSTPQDHIFVQRNNLPQNLAAKVEYQILENFVDSILARIQQNKVTFDHLQYLNSV
jgi:hypothetical protein